MWAALNMYFMWNSFVLHLCAFLWKAFQACCGQEQNFEVLPELKRVIIHIPFAMPLKNIHNTYLLYRLGFGTKELQAKNLKRVEEIQQEAAIGTMYEAFMEGGPQSVTQLVVVLSTGRVSLAQYFSIPISILSLAWSSSRVYFILRVPDDLDADPDKKMVLLRTFPKEVFLVVNSTLLWTMIGGLLGGFTFAGLLLSFLILLLSLHLLEWFNARKGNGSSLGSEGDYKLICAVTAVWLPCLVGEWKSNFFLTSAIVSITTKIFLLVIAFVLADVNEHPFLLWCKSSEDLERHSQDSVKHCQLPHTNDNFTSCWKSDDKSIDQMIRVCNSQDDENALLGVVLGVLAISTALAIWASIRLHQDSNYATFFQNTKKLMCIQTKPVLHRSTVHGLAADAESSGKLQEILGTNDTTMRRQFLTEVNRARRGETPLHVSTKAKNKAGTEILLKAGAIPQENFEKKLPFIKEHLANPSVLGELQESKDKGMVPNHLLIGLRRQLKGQELTEQQQTLFSLVGEGDHLAKQDVSLWDYTFADAPKEIRIKAYQFLEVNQLFSCFFPQ